MRSTNTKVSDNLRHVVNCFNEQQANTTHRSTYCTIPNCGKRHIPLNKKIRLLLYKSNITRRTFTHLRLSLTSDVEDTVPEVAVVMAVVVAAAFTTDGATGTVTAVGTLSFSFSVLSSAHKRFEVLQHNK